MTIFVNNQLKRTKKALKVSLLVSTLAMALTSQAADLYQITDLGSLAPDTVENRTVDAFSINNANSIVGHASGEDFEKHAFAYLNSGLIDLGSLPNTDADGVEEVGESAAFGVNDSDIAVGYSVESFVDDPDAQTLVYSDVEIAVYYDLSALTINRIPQFAPDNPKHAKASAINGNVVVGNMFLDPPNDEDSNGDPVSLDYLRGFFYNISLDLLTAVHPLGNEDSLSLSLRDLNDSGIATGISTETVDGVLTSQVIVVDSATPETVEKIHIFGGNTQQPWAINNAGKIVGKALSEDNRNTEAFIYATPTATRVGYLNNNFKYSEAFDINDSDQVVGTSQVESTPVYHAFLYESDTLKDLNEHVACDSGWQLTEARSINDSGVIAGTGVFEGEKRAFMLTPQSGSKPVCEVEDDTGSGSLPLSALLSLLLFGFIRRQKN